MDSNKNRFIMLVGLPGSGKSTLGEQMGAEPGTLWLSSDNIRAEINGNPQDQSNTELIFNIMRDRTFSALTGGRNVVFDATNISGKVRRGFLDSLKGFTGTKECIICATPFRTCLKWNASRERNVEESIIRRMYMTWSTPAYYEGWDVIRIHYAEGAAGSAGTVEDYVNSLMDYRQDNPYHSETLGEHLRGVSRYLVENYGYSADSNMAIAGLVHDCGKPYTKRFANAHGEPSDFAHFYNHEGVGAYDALFFDYGDKTEADILEISGLVSMHMIPFGWKKKETFLKFRRLWGEDLYTKIMQIHKADEESSKAME